MTKRKPAITRDTVPEGFTLSLAMVDAIPVLFFGATMLRIGALFHSVLFIIGAAVCFLAGAAKVAWKFIVVLWHKNVWCLFTPMRTCMPAGFALMLLSLILNAGRISLKGLRTAISTFPAAGFFLAGVLGMCLMSIFAKKLDSSSVKANWIEQLTNGIAQICFFIGTPLV